MGGRARSYVTNDAIAVRDTKEIVQLFDPDEENHEILTHAGGHERRSSVAPCSCQAASSHRSPASSALRGAR